MNAPEANPPIVNHPRSVSRRLIITVMISVPIGAVLGYVVGRALKKSRVTFVDWTLADAASILIAVILTFSAMYAFWATTSAARWNRMVEKQPADEPVDPGARRSGRWQAAVAAIAAILIATPPITAHAGLAAHSISTIVAGLFVLLAVQSWINWRLWREGDELTRAVVAQTGAVCFWVLQLGLFAWAALTKLGLARDVDSWTLMTVLMGAYLITSVVISSRRGLVSA